MLVRAVGLQRRTGRALVAAGAVGFAAAAAAATVASADTCNRYAFFNPKLRIALCFPAVDRDSD